VPSQPIDGKRFQEIVNRAYLKGFESILVIRGNENDQWDSRPGQLVQNFKTVQSGHLDIEQNKIRLLALYGFQCLYPIGCFRAKADFGNCQ
jgi:hypothetical protein